MALAVIVYFSIRNWLWIFSLPQPEGGEETGFLGARARVWFREVAQPIQDIFAAASIGPDAVTYAQLGVSAVAGLCFAQGAMFLGGWLIIAAGTLDVIDGGLARRLGGGTPRGAFVDSVVDRYAELFTYAGLAVYFRGTWVLWFIGLALFGSLMVSYTRARAEGLGLDCKVGGSQRPERIVVMGFGGFLSEIVAHVRCGMTGEFSHALLAWTLVLLAVLVNVTAIRRAVWSAGRLAGAR